MMASWLLYILEWGVVCEGTPHRLRSSCTANKAGTPRLAMSGMLQRIWMLGTSPRMANECLFQWGVFGGYHLLTRWFVQVWVVWAMLHRYLIANKDSFFFFCWHFCFPCCCCCLCWSYGDVGVNEASLLTGAEWLFVLKRRSQASRRQLSLLVGWAASAWSTVATGSSLDPPPPHPVMMYEQFFRVKEVYVCMHVLHAMNT